VPGTEPPAKRQRHLALSNWPVASRLIAVAVVASVSGLVFGGLRVHDAVVNEQAFGRTAQLASLGEQMTALTQDLEDERDRYAGVAAYNQLLSDAQANVAANQASPAIINTIQAGLQAKQKDLTNAEQVTDTQKQVTMQLLSAIGGGFPASVQAGAVNAATAINQIPQDRAFEGAFTATAPAVPDTAAGRLSAPPSTVINTYSGNTLIAPLLSFDQEITSGSSDAALADDVRALNAISQAKNEASQQRAVVYALLIEGSVPVTGNGALSEQTTLPPAQLATDTGGVNSLVTAQVVQNNEEASDFSSAATAGQATFFAAQTGGQSPNAQTVNNAKFIIANLKTFTDPRQLFVQVNNQAAVFTGAQAANVATNWYRDQTGQISQLRTVEVRIESEAVQRAQSLQHAAIVSALETGGGTVAALLFVLLATAFVGRTLVNPLRRLQADALEIATRRLPERVAAAAASSDSAEASTAVEPIGIGSTDEIGRVARAFDQVHAEAVRLAGTEAQLRGSLNAMFISLSRRSVPLIDRLARLIDTMEQTEDDPDQLANLFSMDHMVTRMRRNSENLLVLAGEEPVRKFSEAVPLTDVARAAAAEIEQYNRVALAVQPGIVIPGQAAADVVHLLAELIENATLFSPQTSKVRVSVMELDSGGVLVEIRDDGVGISESRLADMNWRLDHPPVLDVSISRHMGLYAVARLASRHGIKVRLRPGTPQGLSALVWLPGDLAKKGQLPAQGMPGRIPSGATQDVAPDTRASIPARQRNGALNVTGSQPVLTKRSAPAGKQGTVWFTAKRPSQGSAKSQDEVAAAWQTTGSGPRPEQSRSYAQQPAPQPFSAQPFSAFSHDDTAGPANGRWGAADMGSPAEQTRSGLPRRMPQAQPHPGSDVPETGNPMLGPNMMSAAPPLLGAPAGAQRNQNQDPTSPRRRTPDDVRSRLSGFQLGTRDATQAPRVSSHGQQAGEENGR
jgi:signal transduction histidine kinase